jgi:tol-pal system protein YbgF
MQNRLKKYLQMASLALAIAVPALAPAQSDGGSEPLMEMVLQMQQLQDEIRMLRGRIEEQAFEIESLKRRQRDQYLDLDQRINEIAAGQAMAPGALPLDPATGPAAQVGGQPLEAGSQAAPSPGVGADLPEVRQPIDTPSTVTGLAVPQADARSVAGTPEAEKRAYDSAFQALKDLRYSDAAEAFQAFLDRYPGSEYADNAQYWLGESYYVTRNYEFALEAFETLQQRFPQSPKLPDSLLKIGYTHYELRQWDLARAALTQVKEQYPDTTLARLAESRLRSMRLEGHF